MAHLRNVFLDLQAVDGSGSESEEDENFTESRGFIEDSALSGQGDPLNSHQYLARAQEEVEDENHWQGVLERARAHANLDTSHGTTHRKNTVDTLESSVSSQQSVDSEHDVIELHSWRLEAWPFLEEDVFKNLDHVLKERIMKGIEFIKSEERWPWAKVGGRQRKWGRYSGDTGLIRQLEGDDTWYLALIPRNTGLEHRNEGQSRPPQALATRRSLGIRKAAKVGPSGSFNWKGIMYSAEGCILVELAKITVLPLLEPLPTSTELQLFRSTGLISTAVSKLTEQRIAQSHIKIGNRVKVTTGPYIHSIGEVKEVKERTVTVYLPAQDSVEEMALDTMRAAFTVGDHVRAVDGISKGLTGWVIGVVEGDLCVLNAESYKEFRLSRTDAEFYDKPLSIASKPPQAENPLAIRGKLGGKNPNDIYTSKRVIVIGTHVLKGYKGVIKSTTVDGYAFLQLDTQFQQTVKIALTDLACLKHDDIVSHNLITGRPVEHTEIPWSTSELEAVSMISMVANTPAWEPSDSSSSLNQLSPAWDPSSRTPLLSRSPSPVPPARPVHWLDDTLVWNWRIKLEALDSSPDCPYVEFLGIENGLAKVREKMSTKLLPLDSVTPLPPKSDGDLVVPKTGDLKGVQLRVLRVEGDICTLRKIGTCTPTRKNPDRQFAVSDVVQVYPASRRK